MLWELMFLCERRKNKREEDDREEIFAIPNGFLFSINGAIDVFRSRPTILPTPKPTPLNIISFLFEKKLSVS